MDADSDNDLAKRTLTKWGAIRKAKKWNKDYGRMMQKTVIVWEPK